MASVHAKNFMWTDDNNDKSVTGPQVISLPKKLKNLRWCKSVLSRVRALNGGQFITITKSGGNDFHGSFYGGLRTQINALDNLKIGKSSVRTRSRQDSPVSFRLRSCRCNFSGPLHLPRSVRVVPPSQR